tara:strand:+ start:1881 stop:2114 length:234 start_codon:yes stop_codon:yes gene_type:complete
MKKESNGVVTGLTAMSLDQAYGINLLESPDLLDGTVCLRRGPKMQLPLHLTNRLIRAVAGFTAEDIFGCVFTRLPAD